MRTRKIILILALLAAVTGSRAVNGVWVERIDGGKQCFLFADYPVITCTTDLLVVTAAGAQISGFAPQTAVDIYDTAGRLLDRRQIAPDGTLTVSLSDQPKCIYIIKTNQTTLKIQNR